MIRYDNERWRNEKNGGMHSGRIPLSDEPHLDA
jgi:hypothetical protein